MKNRLLLPAPLLWQPAWSLDSGQGKDQAAAPGQKKDQPLQPTPYWAEPLGPDHQLAPPFPLALLAVGRAPGVA